MDWLSRIFAWLSDHEAGISAVAAIIVIGGVVLAGFRLLVRRRSQPSKETTPEDDPLLALPTGPVVAVLPFENLSRDPDQEYFSDGLTEGIITGLSRFSDLFVIARNSTFRYKNQAVDVRQLNKELGARYVLEGSVQRAEKRLRVTAQLLDARDGTHLWAETYDRQLSASDIFEVQDEITEQVVGTIASGHGVISRARFAAVKEKPTDSLDAYECVLHAAAYYRDRMGVATTHARIRDALERAVKSDPGYAEAWAFLSFAYLDEHRFKHNPRPKPLERALEAARRSVDLDRASQNAHVALSCVYFYRRELHAFLPEAERAMALNPNESSNLAVLGAHLQYAGDEQGIALVRKAAALDPFHPTWFNAAISRHHFEQGEYEEALAAAQRIDVPGGAWPKLYLTASYAELGRRGDAESALEDLLQEWSGINTGAVTAAFRKRNYSDERIRPWIEALRKAGLPEGTEA